MIPNKVNEIITKRVIEQLENNKLEWIRNWSLGIGTNWKTEKTYKGINALLLNMAVSTGNYKNSEWLTYRQIQEAKGHLRAGSKAQMVIYFKVNEYCNCGTRDCIKYKRKVTGHSRKTIPILRYYNVFNIDCTNLKPKRKENKNRPIQEIEEKLSKYWKLDKIRIGKPSYTPIGDYISMPDIKNFDKTENYYSTMAHELVHSTGHETRLSRKGITGTIRRGGEEYAYEELIAELGSAFICAELGIKKDLKNTSAYIDSWIEALRRDTTYIFKACRESQKAQEYILHQEEVNEEIKRAKEGKEDDKKSEVQA